MLYPKVIVKDMILSIYIESKSRIKDEWCIILAMKAISSLELRVKKMIVMHQISIVSMRKNYNK